MRTFWMRIYSVVYWLLVVVFIYILVGIILPAMAEQPEVAAFVPLFAVFLGLFLVVALTTTFWGGAIRRGWIWLAGLIPAILFLLLNAPFIPFALTHPTDVPGFTSVVPLVVGSIVLVVAGWRASRDARAAAPAAPPARRTVLALTATAASVVGALATSFMTGIGGSAGGSVAEATTTTEVEARDTSFTTTALTAKTGETLGIVLINRDSFPHSFDIDALNVHVQMPAHSTSVAAVAPTASGPLEFYCAVPGHREAGMVGSITVE